MFFGQIERECLDPELGYQTKLPEHLQLLVDQQQGNQDIWECQQSQEAGYKPSISVQNSKFILKCLLWRNILLNTFRKIQNSKS
ncbi:hypothetical protein [Calothrix sp. PCC 7507]|uniref:hypothetical protein n=1 Tax=Calothrix sp. PCC 7507 TaxID=99598 RepID=UPI00029EFDA5|nr:hypothetical protein [Calothrix sp. PCC 7507]AFY31758.1 hypothetical protein Cal7507_1287 [Calothrix sp. PCC 7507]